MSLFFEISITKYYLYCVTIKLMKEYQKHIKDERTSRVEKKDISFCGENINMVWAFTGVSHYVASRQCKDRLLCCPKCKRVVIDLLNDEE